MPGMKYRPATETEWRRHGLPDGAPRALYDRQLLTCFHYRENAGVCAQGPTGETVPLHAGPFRERHAAADLIARLAGFLQW